MAGYPAVTYYNEITSAFNKSTIPTHQQVADRLSCRAHRQVFKKIKYIMVDNTMHEEDATITITTEIKESKCQCSHIG